MLTDPALEGPSGERWHRDVRGRLPADFDYEPIADSVPVVDVAPTVRPWISPRR